MKFPSINLQGNILTFDILEQIAQGEAAKQAPRDYGVTTQEELRNTIQSVWTDANNFYDAFSRGVDHLKSTETGTTLTRDRWVLPLLSTLGYEMIRYREGQIINERNYFISHYAENLEQYPIHIVGANLSLDRKGTGMRMSPHALVQEYLNAHENLYAIVTNGRTLRLLRDSSLLTKLSYVEFDLVKIFEEGLYPDFALLYRLLHQSRMPRSPEEGDSSIIEQYHLDGLASGSRIRDKLSIAVEKGILKMATGLLQEPANEKLRHWVQQEPDSAYRYYEHLLKLIYRLLFIMVIEERDLIFPTPPEEAGNNEKRQHRRHQRIYYDYYAIGRLRQLALQYQLANDKHYDLWENLVNTFQLFEPGPYGTKLDIAPLAGDLFTDRALGPLYDCRLNNRALLETLRGLSQFDNDQGQPITVNYGALDVEEFGSIYEGLLEYDPHIDTGTWTFTFVKGEDRSSSGSHYTPDELVQPLIKHSLEHLIQDRLVSLEAPPVEREAAVQALLQLTICDVACGSGHILLAAARRIGLAVARLRTQEEQPNPRAVRQGVREAILNCIYGVDKNPLAVELCKVALWLEAHVPGHPLNFLDHRIKNGDAIVGVAHFEELETGIPDEAFKKLAGDDSEILRSLRKENKKGREGYEKIKASGHYIIKKFRISSDAYAKILALPERTVVEIEEKRQAYEALMNGPDYMRLRRFADMQTAPFFLPKTKENEHSIPTSTDYYRIISKQDSFQSLKVASCTGISYEKKFFHWFLEFPEVFSQGGFNCVLGNPPFLGGQKISGSFGKDYAEFLKVHYAPIGSVDLVTYFFRRIYALLQPGGFQSLISTNTIAQGDAREGGLVVIQEHGGTINHAVRSMKWPGLAAVEVALVTIFKGTWKEGFVLDFQPVEQITSYLDDQEFIGDPYRLAANANKSFQGSIVLGKGFVMEPEEAQRLIAQNPDNEDVLFPYLNGQDLNNQVDQSPTRWVINFFDWPERRYTKEEWADLPAEERNTIWERLSAEKVVEIAPPDYEGSVATDYPDCYAIIEREVKPERQRWKTDKNGKEMVGTYALRKPLPARWWHYGEKRPALYRTIAGMERVLVIALTSKTVGFAFLPESFVYSHATGVIAIKEGFGFALLQSSFHFHWAWRYASSMKNDLRYTPSDVFETFPFPQNEAALIFLDELGNKYHLLRDAVHSEIKLGLTRLYSQFHNAQLVPDYDNYFGEGQSLNNRELKKKLAKETWNLYNHLQKTEATITIGEAVERIVELRRLHQEMDEAVLAAYGWDVDTKRWGKAIRLRHDFYEVDYLPEKDRVRYTIHPEARREVLKRLLLLNHEIHEAEERGVPYEVIDGEKVVALMREQVQTWLPQTDRLHPNTLRFLCSGEDLLPNLERSLVKSYKPFVTQYSSAIENELQHKLFVAFHDHFLTLHPDEAAREDFLKAQMNIDHRLKFFCKQLLRNDIKYTLGNMQFLLNLVYKPTGNTLAASQLLQQFRAFILTVYDASLFTKAFMNDLRAFIQSYRNDAAHTGEVDKVTAEACRDEVRRLMGVLVGKEKTK